MIRGQNKIPPHLPKRLTISFPRWALYDTGTGGACHDLDKIMIEHKERGFNCMRIEDGAGIIHDSAGKPRGDVYFGRAFGNYDLIMRQFAATGEPGTCDVRQRLLDLFRAAKRHGIYVILSSWYYLHTYWYVDQALARELEDIAPEDRFIEFAKFLHYILLELEAEGLDSQIAFAEIFNEADGLCFIDGYGNKNHRTDEELAFFRKKHEEAIAWLKERHPCILFAFDSYSYYADLRQVPTNLEVYNFHNYFMWSVYHRAVESDNTLLRSDPIPMSDIKASTNEGFPAADDWYQRVWFYNNISPDKYAQANAQAKKYLCDNEGALLDKLRETVEHVKGNALGVFDGLPIVSGEGVSYCGSYKMDFEENTEAYWRIVAEMLRLYRELGLWGSVVRTCCGPEDPVWHSHPERILEMNRIFLGEK